jgi:hypothetical protein
MRGRISSKAANHTYILACGITHSLTHTNNVRSDNGEIGEGGGRGAPGVCRKAGGNAAPPPRSSLGDGSRGLAVGPVPDDPAKPAWGPAARQAGFDPPRHPSIHPHPLVPDASALERGPAGFVGNTGSLGEALQC